MACQTRAENETVLPGALSGIRVIEMADEQAEYCGLTLAGLGADVIKVEAPGGNSTRQIGPFYNDQEDPEGSLFFWQYNRGKRSIELDLNQERDRAQFETLLSSAAVAYTTLQIQPADRLQPNAFEVCFISNSFCSIL